MSTWKRLLIAWFFVPVHGFLFRLSGGRLLGRLEGTGVLIVITKGRRSGKQRLSPLLYFQFVESADADTASRSGGTEVDVRSGGQSGRARRERAAANSWPWSPGAGSGDPRRRDPSRSAKRPMNRSDSAVARPSVAAKTFEGACDRIPGSHAQRCCFRQGLPASSSSAWAPALAESGAASLRSGIQRRAAGCSAR